MLAVKEYFQFDPLQEYLKPALIGYSLRAGGYVRMETTQGRLRSETSGLDLGIVEGKLRLFLQGERFPLPTAEEALEKEKRARQAAEQEIQRLRNELEKRQRES